MRTTPLIAASRVLILAALLAACDKPPIQPIQPTPPAQPGGGQPQGRLSTLEIAVPLTIAIGESVQLTSRGRYADGSSRDVTSQVTWTPGHPDVLSVSSTGRATGQASGEANISATLDQVWAGQGGVIVVPAGTFRLSGNVMDERSPVSGVTVTVLLGRGETLTTTASAGFFQFYGVAGDIEVRISKPGFQDLTRKLHIARHEWLQFDLVLANERDRLSPRYDLRIRAADECHSVLPEAGLDRKYTAYFNQDGPLVTATLEGATFAVAHNERMNTFSGVVQPDQITFYLSPEFMETFPFPKVFEQVTASTYFAVSGTVSARISGSQVIGTLDGTILMFDGPAPYRQSASCSSAVHRFELSR